MIKLVFLAAIFAFTFQRVPGSEDRGMSRVPVLLELFTSEGCSSCPPADRLLAEFDHKQPVAGVEVIVLSEHVDYWDRLGWKDRFSSPQNTERQTRYANFLRLDSVYTPQLVVDGRADVVGSDEGEATAVIRKLSREPKIPIEITNVVRKPHEVAARLQFAAVGEAANHGLALYIALADERAETQVARGENAGHSLIHVAVMRSLTQAGTLHSGDRYSKDVTIPLPSGTAASGFRIVAFLQDPQTGYIVGAGFAKSS